MDPFKPYLPKPRALAKSLPRGIDDARTVALQALAFIAGDDDLMVRFVGLTGCDAADLRRQISDDGFLGGVLDFLLGDEPTLLAFVAAADLAPEAPMAARALLP